MAELITKIPADRLWPTISALAAAGVDTEDADWMRAQGNATLVREFIRSQRFPDATIPQYPIPSDYRGPYWDERAEGPYRTYPADWPEATGTPCVLDCDPDFFRGLDFSHVEALVERYHTGGGGSSHEGTVYRTRADKGGQLVLPEHMTALLVFPKLESVARLVRNPKKSWNPENLAMQYILGVLNEVYGKEFRDWTDGNIGPEYHRLAEATAKALAMDAARTPGDVHILPVQTGALFAGYSVRAARGHLSAMPHHYGLHGFGGGVLMLPHSTRSERFRVGALFMDCPGSERSPDADGAFGSAPYWNWSDGGRRFYSFWVNRPDHSAGSGSLLVLPE